MKVFNGQEYLTTLDIQSQYPISVPTIRNWIKSGKVTPDLQVNKASFFLRTTVDSWFKVKG